MKTRILTASILVPLLFIVLFALPEIVTTVCVGLIASVAAYELLYSTNLVRHPRLIAYSMVMAFLVALWSHFGMIYEWAVISILLYTLLLFVEMMRSHIRIQFSHLSMCLVGGVLIPFMLASVVRIHVGRLGRYLIMAPFVMAYLSDTGAYFIGRVFGMHKLAPVISPNKTIEGAVGGVLTAMAGMVIYAVILQLGLNIQVNYIIALIYGLVGSLAGILGDLCFSVIKRQNGLKDFGSVFPGHGGILDRFDSLLVVGPLAEVLLIMFPFVV